jgi:predicted 3-demethylubiquinone-9 3-methyltransferase (glyoxalase superfamily)
MRGERHAKIAPFLWFNGQAEEAMNFYVSVFKNSKDRCGWLQDKYCLSWQIIPSILGRMLQDKDAEKANRVMKAMLQMDKIDIKRLKQAYGAE